MTPDKSRIESAIRHIKTSVDIDPWAVEIAVDALEKQIPKKPIKNAGMVNPIWSIDSNLCPTCFSYVNVWGGKFCSHCSQVIDWTEGEG